MGGKRRRVRRRRAAVMRLVLVSAFVLVATVGLATLGLDTVRLGETADRMPELGQHPGGIVTAVGVVNQPLKVARPIHLDSAYVAPVSAASVIGRLRLVRLGIDAPVVPVGWDHDAMAVPNDAARLGWFEPSAQLTDLAGASLIAGHVADDAARPGALSPISQARAGDIIEWEGSGGKVSHFRVTTMSTYPRAAGLPPAMFGVDGPHTLHLVTCANRQRGADGRGFHYVDNLVVTAIQI